MRGCFAVAALWCVVSPARAESPFQLKASVDLPVFGLAAALSTSALIELPPAACLPSCDPTRVNGFDRGVIGNYSEAHHRAADLLVAGFIVFPLILNAIDSRGKGWLTDTAVFLETMLVTQAVTHLTKAAVRRSAPFVYDPTVPMDVRTGSDSTRSFFSGHTSTAFAAATAYTVTYWLRNPKSPWRWVVLGVGAALAATTGVLKVRAGYHFWSDIVVGAVAGVSVGALVPLLHRRE